VKVKAVATVTTTTSTENRFPEKKMSTEFLSTVRLYSRVLRKV
jgi:hypothetical protein